MVVLIIFPVILQTDSALTVLKLSTEKDVPEKMQQIKQFAYHFRKPDSGYIWHRSWSAEPLHQLPEWSPPSDMTDTRYRHPSVARIREDILCRTCGGRAGTLADGRGHQIDCDKSDTSACARSFQRPSLTLADLQRRASSAQINIRAHKTWLVA